MIQRSERLWPRALVPLALAALLACGGTPTGPDDGDENLPATPVLVTPAGGAQLTTDMPTFTVQNARRFNGPSATYTFQVLTRSGAREVASMPVPGGNGTTSAVFSAPLPRGMTLTWKVTASGAMGQVVSTTATFTTNPVVCESVRGAHAKAVVDWFLPACSLERNAYNDPEEVLRAPDAGWIRFPDGTQGPFFGFMSLGEKGYVTVDMVGCVVDGPGNDVRVWQAVGSEPVTLYASGSPDGPFILVESRKPCGTRVTPIQGYCEFDLAQAEVQEARYFKVEDGEHYPCEAGETDSEGADIDAIEMLNRK